MTNEHIGFNWATSTDEQQCSEFKRLDIKFATISRSPLHHDNRCPIHTNKKGWGR